MTIRAAKGKKADASVTLDLTEVSGRQVAYDYLRAFAVVLVLCHHAVIAYTISASINLDSPIATASPVVNGQRWPTLVLVAAAGIRLSGENAYGIYVVHYVFVTWLQYGLLESPLDPSVKGMVVFLGTLILSWATVAALRRIPAVAKVVYPGK